MALESEQLVQVLIHTLTSHVYWFLVVAVRNYHKVGDKNIFSHCSGGQNSETKCSAESRSL